MRTVKYLLGLCLLLVVGCSRSKELTPESAKAMIQAEIKAKKQVLALPLGGVDALFKETFFHNYATESFTVDEDGAAFQRMVKAGLLEASIQEITQLNISGAYEGIWTKCYNVHFDINLDQFPAVSGVYKLESQGCWPGPRRGETFSGTLSGEIKPYDTILMRFSPRLLDSFEYARLNSNNIQPAGGGESTALTGQTLSGQTSWPISLSRSGHSPQLPVKEYQYLISPVLAAQMRSETKTVEAGEYTLDSVDDLLLVTETVAESGLSWHSKLNQVGSALSGETQVVGKGKAQFRKQPDGVWVLSAYELKQKAIQSQNLASQRPEAAGAANVHIAIASLGSFSNGSVELDLWRDQSAGGQVLGKIVIFSEDVSQNPKIGELENIVGTGVGGPLAFTAQLRGEDVSFDGSLDTGTVRGVLKSSTGRGPYDLELGRGERQYEKSFSSRSDWAKEMAKHLACCGPSAEGAQ